MILIILSESKNHTNICVFLSALKEVGRIVYYSITKADKQSSCASERLLCLTNHVQFPSCTINKFLTLFWSLGLFTTEMRKVTEPVALEHRKQVLCNFLFKKKKKEVASIPISFPSFSTAKWFISTTINPWVCAWYGRAIEVKMIMSPSWSFRIRADPRGVKQFG